MSANRMYKLNSETQYCEEPVGDCLQVTSADMSKLWHQRCPTLAVKDMTPYEAWSGMKPSVDHFRVWGCLAHVHMPKIGRSKLDDRSSTCIFLGVSEGTKGYRLMDTNAKRIVISRDVVFKEDKCWKWGDDYKEHVTTDLEWEDDRIDAKNRRRT
ncbi:hypothetical protein LIER_41565 [Lithospermum erythrorhizon]|uniref:Retroviral polymerase SH3-like domain-containing protein n=1 Tax=Lithospermum erythrorhizon TaxID=34254 RepID=A0AAV3RB97_LITER